MKEDFSFGEFVPENQIRKGMVVNEYKTRVLSRGFEILEGPYRQPKRVVKSVDKQKTF